MRPVVLFVVFHLTESRSLLWRSLFVADIATIEKIAKGWGIAQVRFFSWRSCSGPC